MPLVETDVVKCKNCEADVVGDYCSACGQKRINRLTARYILTLIQNDVFDFDRGLIYTFNQLWKHPGKLVRAYIGGKTKQYYSPLKYLIVWGAVALFVMQFDLTKSNAERTMADLVYNNHAFLSDESLEDLMLIYATALRDYTNIYYIVLVPFLTLVSYLVNYSKKYNIAELSVMYLYISAQIVFTLAVMTVITRFMGPSYAAYVAMAPTPFMLYLIIKCHKEFFEDGWIPSVIKSLVVLNVGQILYLGTAYLVLFLIK